MDVTGSSGSTESTESALRILAVDDDPVNRSLIRAIVSRATDMSIRGATLHEATNLAEARSVLGREAIDILLLDVHLPDGLGLDLAAELRHDGRPGPAILALTASVLPADQQAALDAGCDAFLAKPYAASALVATIAELARLSRDRASS
jgi:two-component system, OmpR family, KDP operon response regulator KdpE